MNKREAPPRGYADLHEHLQRLDEAGLLYRIDAPVNKDTEMHPLVRWQFRGGIPEKDRKAFLFTNVTDSKGRRYDIPVTIGAFAANPEIYRIGMNVPRLEDIGPKWEHAIANPIPPRIVETGPVHDVVLTGDALKGAGNGIESLPVPISTPKLRSCSSGNPSRPISYPAILRSLISPLMILSARSVYLLAASI